MKEARRVLNNKRNNSTQAMKKKFKGRNIAVPETELLSFALTCELQMACCFQSSTRRI